MEQKVVITNSQMEINLLLDKGWKIVSITAQYGISNFCVLLEREKSIQV